MQVNVFPASTGVITVNYCFYRGKQLDRLVETGPRGGKTILWRDAAKRDYILASWSRSRADAVR